MQPEDRPISSSSHLDINISCRPHATHCFHFPALSCGVIASDSSCSSHVVWIWKLPVSCTSTRATLQHSALYVLLVVYQVPGTVYRSWRVSQSIAEHRKSAKSTINALRTAPGAMSRRVSTPSSSHSAFIFQHCQFTGRVSSLSIPSICLFIRSVVEFCE